MNTHKVLTLVLGVMVGLLLVLSGATGLVKEVWAQTGSGYDLTWWTADGGGDRLTGGSYVMQGTVGQPDAGAIIGGGYRLSGGFWPGGVDEHRIYLPITQKN